MTDAAIWRPYCQMQTASPPPEVVATDGVRLRLADGRSLIDGTASWWTTCHGYNHPHIRDAVRHQLDRMPHVMFGGLTHAPAERLAARLAALLPGDLDHVFFTDSGSVAVEVALKIAVQFHRNRGVEGRTGIGAFRGGYHGDTLGAMAVGDPAGMHAAMGEYLPRRSFFDLPVDVASAGAFEVALAAAAPGLAAVILEPLVQAAGGMRFHAPAVLSAVAGACRRHGVLLILDEIMTGFGRTGTMFACEQAQVVPDIICLSKALTGGTITLAATVARRHVFEAFLSQDPAAALMHGPTFMANPLACAAANASLDLFETEPRLEQVRAIEQQLGELLAPAVAIPGVHGMRVVGAVGVIQLDRAFDAQAARVAMIELGVWLRPFGDVFYVTPAFNIAEAELTMLATSMLEAIDRLSDGGSGQQLRGSIPVP